MFCMLAVAPEDEKEKGNSVWAKQGLANQGSPWVSHTTTTHRRGGPSSHAVTGQIILFFPHAPA
jgi:hypothetical protein